MYISADSVFMSFLIFIYQIQYIILHQPQSILFSYHSHAKAPDDQGLVLLHYVGMIPLSGTKKRNNVEHPSLAEQMYRITN